MPIKKSAKKSLKQNKKRHAKNVRTKNSMKELLKETRLLIAKGKKEEVLKKLPKIYKTVDKAAKKRVIAKNTAARMKSRMTKAVNNLTKEKKKEESSVK